MVAARNRAAGAGDCAVAERYGAGHRTCLVRAAGHALFLLADSGIADARRAGTDRRDGAETRKHLENFLEKRGLEPIEFQGARIPVYTGWVPVRRQVGHGSVYLVGDAAAQVKVTTVGGIVTGFRGALGVAEAILNGGSSRALRRLRRELDLHLLLRRSLHDFQQDDYSDWSIC